MKNWLEKQFRLSEFHTDVKTEILAGLTTFVTMAYILATVQWHCLPIVHLLWHRDLEAWVLSRL